MHKLQGDALRLPQNHTGGMMLDKWAEYNSKFNQYGTKEYGPFVCHIMNLFFKKECNFSCGWVSPYGFVPEAACDIHDKEEG